MLNFDAETLTSIHRDLGGNDLLLIYHFLVSVARQSNKIDLIPNVLTLCLLGGIVEAAGEEVERI